METHKDKKFDDMVVAFLTGKLEAYDPKVSGTYSLKDEVKVRRESLALVASCSVLDKAKCERGCPDGQCDNAYKKAITSFKATLEETA